MYVVYDSSHADVPRTFPPTSIPFQTKARLWSNIGVTFWHGSARADVGALAVVAFTSAGKGGEVLQVKGVEHRSRHQLGFG
eukprot:5186286-Pyramimonas_sp.AAC.1